MSATDASQVDRRILTLKLMVPRPERNPEVLTDVPASDATEARGRGAYEHRDGGEFGVNTDSTDVTLKDFLSKKLRNCRAIMLTSKRSLALIWLAGAVVLGTYVCIMNLSVWRTVRRERLVTEQKILDLLEDCKAQMGVRTVLGVVATDRVNSPVLFGFVRPRLLLPAGILETLSLEQLRHVFVHELTHLKRYDILVGWATSILSVLHWFNPLVWYAFYRMRVDRELACDELALSKMTRNESPEYGRTILHVLEKYAQSRSLPCLAGVLENKSQLRKRIAMIARFKNRAHAWSTLAVVVIIVLACVTLTNAKQRVLIPATRQNLIRLFGQPLTYRRGKQLLDGIDDYVNASGVHFETLQRVYAAVEREQAAYKRLEDLLESGNYGNLSYADIVTAQQKIHSAVQHEEQARQALCNSIEEVEDALGTLGVSR
jgi:beta-lactamase regulating signal transducer with metallopeptidase domain